MARGVCLVVLICFVQYFPRSFVKGLTKGLYTNTWVVYTEKGNEYVDKIARERGFINHGQQGGLEGYYLLEHKRVSKRTRRSLDHHTEGFLSLPHIKYAEQQKILSRQKRGYFSDPMFKDQWYLQNTGQSPGPKGLDINVLPVWKKNISGKNVVVTILDDGIEYTHPDLNDNYEASASWDFNSRDSDPMPRYTSDKVNKHGTRCAGEVAGKKDNGKCGVGVAYNARIGGVRMLDGDVTDSVEGSSLSLKSNFIDIYSSSWGPDDDGRTVDGPGNLAKKAFRDGIRKGRKGLGSIFVWATGNGGRFNDYCSCDGYITSIFTISIGAVNDRGKSPWYAEPCPATLAVTYSSGEPRGPDLKIVTTDLEKGCTKEHTGTSAAAPLAAGIFALVLEANPKLSWRDLQHLIVNTSKKTDPNDSEWQVNGAGYHVNNKFGFGVLDTAGLVDAAMDTNWKTAGDQHICKELGSIVNHPIPKKRSLTLKLKSNGCATKSNCVTSLEHVRVYVTISHRRRGSLTITLTSPSGTKSDLLKQRSKDFSDKGFHNWPFMTVFAWGENPQGKWTLEVQDHAGIGGTLERWSLRFYGTCIEPSPNVTVAEKKTCKDVCKKGCPLEFASSCKNCSQYCQCSTGECVRNCDEEDEIDEASKHCLPPNTFTETEKRFCKAKCTNPCPKAKFCNCRTGQCVKACGHEDKIDAKQQRCFTPDVLYYKSHDQNNESREISNTYMWLIIFSLLGLLLAGVLIMYMFKAKHQLCWARPSITHTSPQRNVSYAPVSLNNDPSETPVQLLPPEQQVLVENTA